MKGIPKLTIELLVQEYRAARFAILRNFIDKELAAELAKITCRTEVRRVSVGGSPETWDEHCVSELRPLARVFTAPTIREMVLKATASKAIVRIVTWANSYGPGEFIPPHRDGAGTVQFLICLQAPPIGAGGDLMHEGVSEPVHLFAGDAVLFQATRLEHSTIPINPIADGIRRVVGVARYFCNDVDIN